MRHRWWILLLGFGLAGCCCPQPCRLKAGDAVVPRTTTCLPVTVYGQDGVTCGWMRVTPDWQLVPPGVQE